MVKKNILFLAIGQLSLFLGLLGFLLNYLVLNHNSALAFVTGLLLGLATVLNLAYLLRRKIDG